MFKFIDYLLELTLNKCPFLQDLNSNSAVALIECQAFDGLPGSVGYVMPIGIGELSTPLCSPGRVI